MELLEIERELKGPDREAALEKYDGVLVALQERLQTALREGMSPEEYGRAEELDGAIVVARKLMRLEMKD